MFSVDHFSTSCVISSLHNFTIQYQTWVQLSWLSVITKLMYGKQKVKRTTDFSQKKKKKVFSLPDSRLYCFVITFYDFLNYSFIFQCEKRSSSFKHHIRIYVTSHVTYVYNYITSHIFHHVHIYYMTFIFTVITCHMYILQDKCILTLHDMCIVNYMTFILHHIHILILHMYIYILQGLKAISCSCSFTLNQFVPSQVCPKVE